MKNFSIYFKKENLFFIYIIFSWLTSLSAIGINPGNLLDVNFKDQLYFLRGTLPLLNFLILIFFIFNERKIFPFKNIFFLLFLFYFFFQIFASIYHNTNYADFYYLINSFNILITLLFVFQKKNIEIQKTLLYILLIFLSFHFIFFFFLGLKIFIKVPYSMYMSWGTVTESFSSILGANTYIPNVLGISRSGLILFIFLFLFWKSNKKIFSKISIVLLPIIATSFFLLQSRAILLLYSLFLLFFFLFFAKKNYLNILKYIFFFFILPFLLFALANYFKFTHLDDENKKTFTYHTYEHKDVKEKLGEKEVLLDKPSIFRHSPKGNFSSDRVDDWKNIISLGKNSFFGYGPQADRQIYKKTASNGLVYAFICSGYIGVIIFIAICGLSSLISFIFIIKKISNKNRLLFFCPIIVFILLLRSFFETSFAVFGIDYVIFIYSVFYVQYNLPYNNL